MAIAADTHQEPPGFAGDDKVTLEAHVLSDAGDAGSGVETGLTRGPAADLDETNLYGNLKQNRVTHWQVQDC